MPVILSFVHFDFALKGFKLDILGGFKSIEGGFKPEHYSIPLLIIPIKNKGSRSRQMCRKPLFSAVFLIFSCCRLYQLSDFHFRIGSCIFIQGILTDIVRVIIDLILIA